MNKEEDRIELMNSPGYGSVPQVQENSAGTEEKQGVREKPKSGISVENAEHNNVKVPENKPQKEKCLWKLVLLIIPFVNTILISMQAFKFAEERSRFSDIVNRGHITLRHLLLKGWESGMETDPYPPPRGEFAVYEIEELIGSINYAVERYFNAEHNAIGFYKQLPHKDHNDTITIRMSYFDFPGFHSSMTGLHIEEYRHAVGIGLNTTTDPATNTTRYTYNIEELFDLLNITDPVRRLLAVHLDFTIHSVRVNEDSYRFDCLFIDGTVSFLDDDNNGQMVVDLITKTNKLSCSDIGYNMPNSTDDKNRLWIAVVVFCVLDAVYKILMSASQTNIFQKIKKLFPTNEAGTVCKSIVWGLIMVVSDCFTVAGVLKLRSVTLYTLWDFDLYAILLGIGGFLNYLNWFQMFNACWLLSILLDTLSGAYMIMLTYLGSIAVLFLGFVLLGNVVLGPYHVKFRTMLTTIETLFSILNGDELFATLANVESSKSGNEEAVLWFSRFFICIYVSVFTIVVLNIFIAIFVNTYERIEEKNRKKHGERQVVNLETVV